ncbi:metal ABC transporter permease [Gemmata sp.]|uniref:metal ABC transporter permease n=1 Tax=Gemmata sp. TaxID=1914242 RepID=UPI003F6E81CA
MSVDWLTEALFSTADALGTDYLVLKSVLAVVLVCSMCGMLGSMVVGNRMAFFSDTMAHCAFAGVALGYLSVLLSGGDRALATWVVPLAMVAVGIAVGAGMVYVRDNTGLAHDTVIGVFFALAIGFGAMLYQVLSVRFGFNPESFFFGSLALMPDEDLFFLLVLAAAVTPVFAWRYNQLVFDSFNPTLARTRGLSLTLNNYLFIILLALVVNLSLKAVGALLINAMLVVPGAAAANLSRNLRQMFWLTFAFCLGSGLFGFAVRNSIEIRVGGGEPILFGPSGVIVVTTVCVFFGTMVLGAVWNRFAPVLGFAPLPLRGVRHVHDASCSDDHGLGQCP